MVPAEENPADLLTRGIAILSDFWWSRTKWLAEESTCWSQTPLAEEAMSLVHWLRSDGMAFGCCKDKRGDIDNFGSHTRWCG